MKSPPFDGGSGSGSGVSGRLSLLLLLAACGSALVARYEDLVEWFRDGGGREVDVAAGQWGVGGPSGGRLGLGLGDEDDDEGYRGSRRAPPPPRRQSPAELRDALRSERAALRRLLVDDYGEYADAVFNVTDILNGAFRQYSEASSERLKRRMKAKIVEAQLRPRKVDGAAGDDDDDDDAVTYTWVTGGHSAAAGHGNLFEQQYTVILEKSAAPFFEVLGVKFRTGAYAMGSMSSGPELGLCLETIYGRDIDILSWDFGMIDGKEVWKYLLWAERAGMHPTFPSLVSHDRGGKRHGPRMAALERRGQSSFVLTGKDLLTSRLPDSDALPDPDGLLPRAVARYVCGGGHVEPHGSPVCGKDYKWDVAPCDANLVKGQVSWHPGWKDHLLHGRLLAIFLTEHLIEAVDELAERESAPPSANRRGLQLGGGVEGAPDAASTSPSPRSSEPPSLSREYLRQLDAEEKKDRELFRSSDAAEGILDDDRRLWSEAFARGYPICRSALLPNRAQFDGVMDGVEARVVGPGGETLGVPDRRTLDSLPDPCGPPLPNDALKGGIDGLRPPWPTAVDQFRRQPCDRTLNVDYRDGFVVRESDGWMGDVYPSDREAEAFASAQSAAGSSSPRRRGVVVLCEPTQGLCPHGHCPHDVEIVRHDEIGPEEKGGNLTVEIDGRTVETSEPFGHCRIMVGKDGNRRFGPESGKARYPIKFRVNKPGGAVFISSIIVA